MSPFVTIATELQRKAEMLRGSPIMNEIIMGIPDAVAGKVLYENDHTCCICNDETRDVQIHHIDGKDANNSEANLAVLCLNCHSKATGNRGLGRKYSTEEVRRYKANWEVTVKRRRGEFGPSASPAKEDWIQFEIARITYEFAVTKNAERTLEILEILDMYYLFEGSSSYAIDRLNDIVPFISSPRKSRLVALQLLHYFWHLPGPEHVKIRSKDVESLEKAIRTLEWIGVYEATSRRAPGPISASLDSLVKIHKIASLYDQQDIQNHVLSAIKKIKEKASETLGYSDQTMNTIVQEADTILREHEIAGKNGIGENRSRKT
jgi:hypothetical protein